MEQLLAKIREVNQIFQKRNANTFLYEEICEILGNIMESNFYIILSNGTILGDFYTHEEDSSLLYDQATGLKKFCKEENDFYLEIVETQVNFSPEEVKRNFKSARNKPDKYHMFIPIYGGGKRLGIVVISRYERFYETRDTILAEYVATVVGIEIERRKDHMRKEVLRDNETARQALEYLSYSELIALKEVLKVINEKEGIIVGSKIADHIGITRSTIVTCLRKLESSGIIEARSLGMKGTKVKVINDHLAKELAKVKL